MAPLTQDILRRMIELDRRAAKPINDHGAMDEFMGLLWGTKERPGYWNQIAQLALKRLEERTRPGRRASPARYQKQKLKKREHRILLMVFGKTCTTPADLGRLAASGGRRNHSGFASELRSVSQLLKQGLLAKDAQGELSVTELGQRLLGVSATDEEGADTRALVASW